MLDRLFIFLLAIFRPGYVYIYPHKALTAVDSKNRTT